VLLLHKKQNFPGKLENMTEEKKQQKKKILDHVKIEENLSDAKENFIKNYLIMNFAVQTIPLNNILFELEKDLIKYALLISEENQKKAAFLLGLNPSTLCEKMKKFNIKRQKTTKEAALLKSLKEISTFFSDT
jgi:DNA-binding protein Fis